MAYNGNLETMYLDPVSFVPNQRCAFELDGTKLAYMSNMRLLNLGVITDDVIDYNEGLGALSLIKNIRLMDARTELSALRNPAQYLFFKNSNRTNATNKSEDKYLKRYALGAEVLAVNNKVSGVITPGRANTNILTTSLAYLDLREVFPILNEMSVLPVAIFKNLRIEIEFGNRQVLMNVNRQVNVQRPILAVDVLNNPNAVATAAEQLMSDPIMWSEIETDNYTINATDTSGYAVAETTTQTSNNNSLGFKGKYIERLLVCKQLQDITLEQTAAGVVQGFSGLAASQAMLDETTQFRVNGRNIFPGFNGINKPNEMLAMVSDEYGSLSAYPGSNLYKTTISEDNLNDPKKGGQQSFSCVRLGMRIADLQVQIARTNNNDTGLAPTNLALAVNLYGEVSKLINISSNGYRIVYA